MNGLLRSLLPIRLFDDLIEVLNGQQNGRLYKMREMLYMDGWFPVQLWYNSSTLVRKAYNRELDSRFGQRDDDLY